MYEPGKVGELKFIRDILLGLCLALIICLISAASQ